MKRQTEPHALPRIAVAPRLFAGDPATPGAWSRAHLFFGRTLGTRLGQLGALVCATALPEADACARFAGAYANACDGLLLQGGADVGAGGRGAGGDRDRFEIELVARFVELGKPVLGICRGMQLINVAFGGSLDAITAQDCARHSDPARYDAHEHAVDLADDGHLSRLYATNQGIVSSAHQQRIDRLGRGLRIDATATDDGCIEAIAARGHPHVVGVQWHPEFDEAAHGRLDGARLLAAFVDAARDGGMAE